jgi:hypothetical protein
VQVTGEEVFHGLRDGELHGHEPAVTQHHDEEAQAPAGAADVDRAVVAPVHLGALAGRERQRQERRVPPRPDCAQIILQDRQSARIAGLVHGTVSTFTPQLGHDTRRMAYTRNTASPHSGTNSKRLAGKVS